MRRYVYIVIGIVVAAIVAILVLLFIKKEQTASSGSTLTGSTTTTGLLPSVGTQGSNPTGTVGTSGFGTTGSGPSTGGTSGSGQTTAQNFGPVSNDPILDYFVGPQNTVTAIEPTGAIVTIADGQSTTINSSTINDIISASFSYDGKKILVNFGSLTDPQSSVFDLTSQTWAALPQGMQSPQWSGNSYQIAYLNATPSGALTLSTLNTGNLKKSAATLLTLNASGLMLQWPMQNQFVLSDRPTAYSAGSAWGFNSQTGVLTPLVYETPGVESIWSSDATTPYGLVFSISPSGQSDVLQLQPLFGTAPTRTLNFITLPSKCTFNNTTAATASSTASSSSDLMLYCGVPRSSSGVSSAQLPDAYNDKSLFTSDDIYAIDTVTGESQTLWSDQTQNMDVSDMKLFNGTLFFVNRYDQKLYSLTLAQ